MDEEAARAIPMAKKAEPILKRTTKHAHEDEEAAPASTPAKKDKAPAKKETPPKSKGSPRKPKMTKEDGKLLTDLRREMTELGVPKDALPDILPSGKKGYTLYCADTVAQVQCLHSQTCYYVEKSALDWPTSLSRRFSWNKIGGASETWGKVTELTGFVRTMRSDDIE